MELGEHFLLQQTAPGVERLTLQIAAGEHEHIEDVIEDRYSAGAAVLERSEGRPARFVQRDDFAVEHALIRQALQRFGDSRILVGKVVVVARAKLHPAAPLDCERAIAVELQLVYPLLSFGQRLAAQKEHGFDERCLRLAGLDLPPPAPASRAVREPIRPARQTPPLGLALGKQGVGLPHLRDQFTQKRLCANQCERQNDPADREDHAESVNGEPKKVTYRPRVHNVTSLTRVRVETSGPLYIAPLTDAKRSHGRFRTVEEVWPANGGITTRVQAHVTRVRTLDGVRPQRAP